MPTMPVPVGRFFISIHGWDHISCLGPAFDYFSNAKKTWLVVKEQYLELAQTLFADTCVNDGRPHLGVTIRSPSFVEQYISGKVNSWVAELKVLTSIAITQSHAAFLAFTHGLISKWLLVKIPDAEHLFQPLEDCVRNAFISAVTGHSLPGGLERALFCPSSQTWLVWVL